GLSNVRKVIWSGTKRHGNERNPHGGAASPIGFMTKLIRNGSFPYGNASIPHRKIGYHRTQFILHVVAGGHFDVEMTPFHIEMTSSHVGMTRSHIWFAAIRRMDSRRIHLEGCLFRIGPSPEPTCCGCRR